MPAPTLRRFWQMLAHVHGQLWNASRLAANLAVSAPSVARYLDILEETYLIRRLPPFHANLHKRLVRSPKIYFRDSGLLHALLGIPDREALIVHPSLGASWEGWVVEQVLGVMPSGWQASFYRTAGGAEVDLLLHPRGSEAPIAVEVKRTSAPSLSRGFREAFRDLQCQAGFLLYAGPDDFPLAEEVPCPSPKSPASSPKSPCSHRPFPFPRGAGAPARVQPVTDRPLTNRPLQRHPSLIFSNPKFFSFQIPLSEFRIALPFPLSEFRIPNYLFSSLAS